MHRSIFFAILIAASQAACLTASDDASVGDDADEELGSTSSALQNHSVPYMTQFRVVGSTILSHPVNESGTTTIRLVPNTSGADFVRVYWALVHTAQCPVNNAGQTVRVELVKNGALVAYDIEAATNRYTYFHSPTSQDAIRLPTGAATVRLLCNGVLQNSVAVSLVR